MHCTCSSSGRKKARANKSREACSQFYDGHTANQKGMIKLNSETIMKTSKTSVKYNDLGEKCCGECTAWNMAYL